MTLASSPEKLLYKQGDIASSNRNRLDVAANDVPVGNWNDVRHPIAAVNYCTSHCTSFLLHVHRQEKTMLLSVIEEKPMFNLSFPLAKPKHQSFTCPDRFSCVL